MADYTHRTVSQKLGIRSGMRAIFINEPSGFKKVLGVLPNNVQILKRLANDMDFIHFFATTRTDVNQYFPLLKEKLKKSGQLWISWPKGKTQPTDLKENIIRELGLEHGLVDVKVIAIDDVWSGLKFIFRFHDR